MSRKFREIINHTYERLHLFFTGWSWHFCDCCYFTLGWLVAIGGIGLPKEINLFFFILQLFIVESDSTAYSSIKQGNKGMVMVLVVLLLAYNHYVICNDNHIFDVTKALIQLALEDICGYCSPKWHDCVPEAPNLSIEGSYVARSFI